MENKKKRTQVTKKNEGIFRGKVFVKKANMFQAYEKYNTFNKTDKEEWV